MNRRGFLKFLGIGAAAAVVAPQVLAEAKTIKSGWYASYPSNKIVEQREENSLPAGHFMHVIVARNTMPFRVGDLVRYKFDKHGYMIAYRSNYIHNDGGDFGVAINNASPGCGTFIMIVGPDLTVRRLADGSLKAL